MSGIKEYYEHVENNENMDAFIMGCTNSALYALRETLQGRLAFLKKNPDKILETHFEKNTDSGGARAVNAAMKVGYMLALGEASKAINTDITYETLERLEQWDS